MASMNRGFDGLYSTLGRASITPECLLRMSMLEVIHTIRSKRQLVDQIDFNLLVHRLLDGRADVGSLDPSATTATGCSARI
jgi:transposase